MPSLSSPIHRYHIRYAITRGEAVVLQYQRDGWARVWVCGGWDFGALDIALFKSRTTQPSFRHLRGISHFSSYAISFPMFIPTSGFFLSPGWTSNVMLINATHSNVPKGEDESSPLFIPFFYLFLVHQRFTHFPPERGLQSSSRTNW